MKILIVADLHYALPQFDWVVAAAPSYDLVILAGDLLDITSAVDPGTQIVVVLNYLQQLRALTRIVVCSGNHDLDVDGPDGERQAGWMERVRHLDIAIDGDTLEVDGWLFSVCPWWDGPQAQAAIAAQLESTAPRRSGPWVWVYHAPPLDSPVSWSGQRHFGDAALSGWITRYQPDIVLSGHVHEAPFSRKGSWVDRVGTTWVFNAGRQYGGMPTTIAIDTVAREAAWFSVEGAESIHLDGALVRPLPQLTALPSWMRPLPGPG